MPLNPQVASVWRVLAFSISGLPEEQQAQIIDIYLFILF
jgi:hypothetical protein